MSRQDGSCQKLGYETASTAVKSYSEKTIGFFFSGHNVGLLL